MGKLLRIRDYIFLSLALIGEGVEEVRLAGGLLPAAMVNRYGFVPEIYKRRSYLTAVAEMLSTKDIERVVDRRGRVRLVLTSAGKRSVKRSLPLLVQKAKPWDRQFMLVIFDIPEKDRQVRTRLVAKLRSLGFGMLQKSVWISPHHFEEDFREYLIRHGLGREVLVLKVGQIWAGRLKEMTGKAWEMKKLNARYQKVVDLIDRQSKGNFTKAVKLYLSTLAIDPLLPEALLPNDWRQKAALKAIDSRG